MERELSFMSCLWNCKTSANWYKSPPYGGFSRIVTTSKGVDPYKMSKSGSPYKTRKQSQSHRQAVLMGSIEEMAKQSDFIDPEAFAKSDNDDKLLTIITSLNKLHNKFDSINDELYKESREGEKEGLVQRVADATVHIGDLTIEKENQQADMLIMKGIIARQEQQIDMLNRKVNELQSRQMSDYMSITGLLPIMTTPEGQKEHYVNTVVKFLEEYLDIECNCDNIWAAYRIGPEDEKIGRMMVTRFHPRLKEKVLANSKKLKDAENPKGEPIYINQMAPESATAERKELSHMISKIKKGNSTKAPGDKTKYQVRNKQLIVDDVPVKKQVEFPTVAEIFAEEAEMDKMEKIKLWFSDPLEEKGSIFTAVAAKTSSIIEVKRAYKKVRRLYSSATHIVLAYDCQKKQGCWDDNEYSAGLQVQKVLEQSNAMN